MYSLFLYKTLKRSLAVGLSLCMLWSSGGIAEAAIDLSHPAPRPAEIELAPPLSLGQVVDHFDSPTKDSNRVILIQDLHAHYGVQKNIAGILEFLSRRLSSPAGVSGGSMPFALAVEGAAGPVDSSVMTLFPDTKIKLEAADYLMREGELTGAEYFAIQKNLAHALTGVEDMKYYLLHRDLFRKTLADRQDVVQSLLQIQKDLIPLQKRICNRTVRKIQAKSDAFEKGDLSLSDYTAYLTSLAGEFGLPLEASYPNLAGFLRGSSRPDPDLLLREASDLAFHLQAAHAASKQEKDLLYVAHDLSLLLRVADLRATEREVRDFGPRMNEFVALAGALTNQKFDETRLRHLISSSIDYYVMAMLRNKPMVENTLALLSQRDLTPETEHLRLIKSLKSNVLNVRSQVRDQPDVAVLIAGGFHTAPITRLLRERGISYLVISPTVDQLTEADHELYVKRLSGQLLTVQDVLTASPAGSTHRWWEKAKRSKIRLAQFLPFRFPHFDKGLAIGVGVAMGAVGVAALVHASGLDWTHFTPHYAGYLAHSSVAPHVAQVKAAMMLGLGSAAAGTAAREIAKPFWGQNPIEIFDVTDEQRQAVAQLINYPIDGLIHDFLTMDTANDLYRQTVTTLSLNGNLLTYVALRRLFDQLKDHSQKQRDLIEILRNVQYTASFTGAPKSDGNVKRINRRTFATRSINSYPVIDSHVLRETSSEKTIIGDMAVSDGTSALELAKHYENKPVKVIGYDRMLSFSMIDLRPNQTMIFDSDGHLWQVIAGDRLLSPNQFYPETVIQLEGEFRLMDKKNIQTVSLLNPEAEAYALQHPDKLEFRTHDVFQQLTQRHQFIRVLGLLNRGEYSYFSDRRIQEALNRLGEALTDHGYLMNGTYWEEGEGQYDLFQRQGARLVHQSLEGYSDSHGWESIEINPAAAPARNWSSGNGVVTMSPIFIGLLFGTLGFLLGASLSITLNWDRILKALRRLSPQAETTSLPIIKEAPKADKIPESMDDFIRVFGNSTSIEANINEDIIKALALKWDESNLAVVKRRIQNAIKIYEALNEIREANNVTMRRFEQLNPGKEPGSLLSTLAEQTHNAWLSGEKGKPFYVAYTQPLHDLLADASERAILRTDNGIPILVSDLENPKKKYKWRLSNFQFTHDEDRTAFARRFEEVTGRSMDSQFLINTVAGEWDVLNHIQVRTNPEVWSKDRPAYLYGLQADSVAAVVGAFSDRILVAQLSRGTKEQKLVALLKLLREINVSWRLNNPWGGFNDRLIHKPFDLEENGGIGVEDIRKDALVLEAILRVIREAMQTQHVVLDPYVKIHLSEAFHTGLDSALDDLVDRDLLTQLVKANPVSESFTPRTIKSAAVPASLAYWTALAMGRDRPTAIRWGQSRLVGYKAERVVLGAVGVMAGLFMPILGVIPLAFAAAHWVPMSLVWVRQLRAPPGERIADLSLLALLKQFAILAAYSLPVLISPLATSIAKPLLDLALSLVAATGHTLFDQRILYRREYQTFKDLKKSILQDLPLSAEQRTAIENAKFLLHSSGSEGLALLTDSTGITVIDPALAHTLSQEQLLFTLAHELGHVLQAPKQYSERTNPLRLYYATEFLDFAMSFGSEDFSDEFGMLILGLMKPKTDLQELERLPAAWDRYSQSVTSKTRTKPQDRTPQILYGGKPRFNNVAALDPHRPTLERVKRLQELGRIPLTDLAATLGLKLRNVAGSNIFSDPTSGKFEKGSVLASFLFPLAAIGIASVLAAIGYHHGLFDLLPHAAAAGHAVLPAGGSAMAMVLAGRPRFRRTSIADLLHSMDKTYSSDSRSFSPADIERKAIKLRIDLNEAIERLGGSARSLSSDEFESVVNQVLIEQLQKETKVQVSPRELWDKAEPDVVREIAAHHGISSDLISSALKQDTSMRPPIAFPESLSTRDLNSIPSQDPETSPEWFADKAALEEAVDRTIRQLNPREIRVLEAQFGLREQEEKSLEELADEFHVTPERIRQIRDRAVRKLRHPMTGRLLFNLDQSPFNQRQYGALFDGYWIPHPLYNALIYRFRIRTFDQLQQILKLSDEQLFRQYGVGTEISRALRKEYSIRQGVRYPNSLIYHALEWGKPEWSTRYPNGMKAVGIVGALGEAALFMTLAHQGNLFALSLLLPIWIYTELVLKFGWRSFARADVPAWVVLSKALAFVPYILAAAQPSFQGDFTPLLLAFPLPHLIYDAIQLFRTPEPNPPTVQSGPTERTDVDSTGIHEIGNFDETMREKGWGVLDTRGLAVGKYINELIDGYKNVFERHGKPVELGKQAAIAMRGQQPGINAVQMSAEAQQAVQEWADTTLERLRSLFPDENLEVINVNVGVGFNYKGRVSGVEDPVSAHVDGPGTYLQATSTLKGASSYLFPNATHDFLKNSPLSNSGLGEPIIPPSGTTVVVTGADRTKALQGNILPSMHSSPLDSLGNPDERVTLFLTIERGNPLTPPAVRSNSEQQLKASRIGRPMGTDVKREVVEQALKADEARYVDFLNKADAVDLMRAGVREWKMLIQARTAAPGQSFRELDDFFHRWSTVTGEDNRTQRGASIMLSYLLKQIHDAAKNKTLQVTPKETREAAWKKLQGATAEEIQAWLKQAGRQDSGKHVQQGVKKIGAAIELYEGPRRIPVFANSKVFVAFMDAIYTTVTPDSPITKPTATAFPSSPAVPPLFEDRPFSSEVSIYDLLLISAQKLGLSEEDFLKGRVLNVGAGSERDNLTTALQRRGARVFSLDPQVMHGHLPFFTRGVVQNIPFTDNSFDSAISIGLFNPEFFDMDAMRKNGYDEASLFYQEAAKELRRVLKHQGRFLLSVGALDADDSLLKAFAAEEFEIHTLMDGGYLLINHKPPVNAPTPSMENRPGLAQSPILVASLVFAGFGFLGSGLWVHLAVLASLGMMLGTFLKYSDSARALTPLGRYLQQPLEKRPAIESDPALDAEIHLQSQILKNYTYSHFNSLSESDREDLVQQTWTQVLRNRTPFKGDANIKTFLIRSLINVYRNHMRTRSRRQPRQQMPLEDMSNEDIANVSKGAPTPELILHNENSQAHIRQALESLPSETSRILQLWGEGEPYKTISETENVPMGTTKSRIHSGLKALAEAFRSLQTPDVISGSRLTSILWIAGIGLTAAALWTIGHHGDLAQLPPLQDIPTAKANLGIFLGIIPQLTLKQRVSQELSLRHIPMPDLILDLNLEDAYPVLDRAVLKVWDAAAKRPDGIRYFKNSNLGLDFKYAVFHRSDREGLSKNESQLFGTMLDDSGGAFSLYSQEDGSYILLVDGDLFPDEFVDLIGIHEYGESVFQDHYKATQLEFEAARRLRKTSRYIQWLADNHPDKITNVFVVKNYFDYLPDTIKRDPAYKDLSDGWRQTPSGLAAEQLVRDLESKDWPLDLLKMAKKAQDATAKAEELLRLAFDEIDDQADMLPIDTWQTHLQQIDAIGRDAIARLQKDVDVRLVNADLIRWIWSDRRARASAQLFRTWDRYKEVIGQEKAAAQMNTTGGSPGLGHWGVFEVKNDIVGMLRSPATTKDSQKPVKQRSRKTPSPAQMAPLALLTILLGATGFLIAGFITFLMYRNAFRPTSVSAHPRTEPGPAATPAPPTETSNGNSADSLIEGIKKADPDLEIVKELHGANGQVDAAIPVFSHAYEIRRKASGVTNMLKVAGGILFDLDPSKAKYNLALEASWLNKFRHAKFAPRLNYVYIDGKKINVMENSLPWDSMDAFSREKIEGKMLHQALANGEVTPADLTPQFWKIFETFEENGVEFMDYRHDAFIVTPQKELKVIDFGLLRPNAKDSRALDRRLDAAVLWRELMITASQIHKSEPAKQEIKVFYRQPLKLVPKPPKPSEAVVSPERTDVQELIEAARQTYVDLAGVELPDEDLLLVFKNHASAANVILHYIRENLNNSSEAFRAAPVAYSFKALPDEIRHGLIDDLMEVFIDKMLGEPLNLEKAQSYALKYWINVFEKKSAYQSLATSELSGKGPGHSSATGSLTLPNTYEVGRRYYRRHPEQLIEHLELLDLMGQSQTENRAIELFISPFYEHNDIVETNDPIKKNEFLNSHEPSRLEDNHLIRTSRLKGLDRIHRVMEHTRLAILSSESEEVAQAAVLSLLDTLFKSNRDQPIDFPQQAIEMALLLARGQIMASFDKPNWELAVVNAMGRAMHFQHNLMNRRSTLTAGNRSMSRRTALGLMGSGLAGLGLAWTAHEIIRDSDEVLAALAPYQEDTFMTDLSQFKNRQTEPAPLRSTAGLTLQHIEVIEKAAQENHLEPHLVAAFLLEEMEHQNHGGLRSRIREGLAKLQSVVTQVRTIGLGQIGMHYMYEPKALKMLANQEAFISAQLPDDNAREQFHSAMIRYRRDIAPIDPSSQRGFLESGNTTWLEDLLELDAVNIFMTAYAMRSIANDLAARKGQPDIPSMKAMNQTSVAWAVEKIMPVPAQATNVRLEGYRSVYQWSVYPPWSLQVFLANRYTGSAQSAKGLRRGLRKVELYRLLLAGKPISVSKNSLVPVPTLPGPVTASHLVGFGIMLDHIQGPISHQVHGLLSQHEEDKNRTREELARVENAYAAKTAVSGTSAVIVDPALDALVPANDPLQPQIAATRQDLAPAQRAISGAA
jgi:RNA polymerase sigma factor (sigma-70 family)